MSNNNVTTNTTSQQLTLLPPKMFNDCYEFSTCSGREFVDTVQLFEREDKYTRVNIADVSVFPLVDVEDELDANLDSSFDEAVADTKVKLKLGISFTDEDGTTFNYPLRETARKSLFDRAKISGQSLDRLTKAKLCTVLNMCYELYPQNSTLVYFNNKKVSAVLSGDDIDFSVMPLTSLLDVLHTKFDELSFEFRFLKGYLDHYYCFSQYEIVDSNLLESYQEALKAHNIPFNPRTMKAAVQFLSSNVGMSSAKVSAFIKNDDHLIPLGTACAVQHRNGKTVEDFKNSLVGMFGSYQEALMDLTKLMDIKLKYPVDVMKKICKKLKFPMEQANGAIKLFESYAGNGTTAYDVYCALGEVIYNCTVSKVAETKVLLYSEDMPKVLAYTDEVWKDLDIPVKDTW